MKDLLLKSEVYCRLRTLEKQFGDLLCFTFPTLGSRKLCELLIKIIQQLESRFDHYTPEQVKGTSKYSSILHLVLDKG
jgi:hypothetical protein